MATVLLPDSPAGAPAPAQAPPAVEHPPLPQPEPRWSPRPRRGRFLVNLTLGATLMALVHLFVVQISVVRGHSMEPALQDGDRLVVDRVSCTLGQVQRNEIVVLRCPRNPEVDYVKRIVGLPGDRIEMRRGSLYVNGELLTGDYQPVPDEAELPELTVPEGNYYVLGRVRARFWPPGRLAVF
jgi:signal peptidase I